MRGATISVGGPGPSFRAANAAGQLTVTEGPDTGEGAFLDMGESTVGRHADATLVLADERASRWHTRSTVMPDGSLAVTDLKSRNGTLDNGANIGGRRYG